MARTTPEAKFTTAFGRSWNEAGGWWYKIPDAKGRFAMFTNSRPFDVVAGIGGVPMAIEAKYCKTIKFAIKELKKHQIENLTKASRQGYKASVLVCYHRLQGKVADFFMLSDVLIAQRNGFEHLLPEQAALRVYARTKQEWIIQPDKIAMMTAPEQGLGNLFTEVKNPGE